MAETMNLGPEWMKNSSGANQSSGPVPKTPTTPTVSSFMSFRKFALAEFRYGKEDILALYAENFTVSGSVLQSVSLITSEIVKPMAFLPYSEEEQLLFAGCVNSNNSLRLIGRGGGPRGGRGSRGRGRGRGGSDGGYYHRSFSFDEQTTSGGNTDHFNRSPMDGSTNRGGYEYGRGRGGGGGGARLGWNNSWRDGSHNSEDERWNSGTNTRWPLSSPGSHPGRSDGGWRNRDESKKDSLLPEWAQQDTTDGKSTQKDSNGGSTPATEPAVKDKPPVVDKVDTKLSPIDDKNDNKNSCIKRPEEPQSEVTAQPPGSSDTTVSSLSSLHTQESVNCKVEDKPTKTFADNKKITPLSPVANDVRQPTRNEPSQLGKTNKTNGHHEEPFSPDGFTQFEKQAEDLLLTEEEETPSSSPITLTGGSVTDTLLTSAVNNNTITFTNSHTRLHQQPQSNPMQQQITPPVVKQPNRPTTLPTPTKPPAIEEFYTWYYQDPDGMIQGPFTSGEMKDWFDAGYFTMDLMVRRACDSHMLPLGQVIQMWKRIPFVTEGKQPPPVKITEPFWKPLMQRQPLLFQQRQQQQQQPQQQMSLQTHAATTTTSDLTSTAESIWGRGAAQEKAMPSTQWPNIESVWEQSQTSPQEDYVRHKEEVRRLEQERQEQKKLEEQRRKEEAAQQRLEEEIRLKQQQEMEAKALKETKERQERERIRLLEEERKRKEEEAEQERERQRQLEQERLAEWKRNEEAKKFLQQQQEAERRLREQQQQQVLLEAAHDQQRSSHPQSIQQQQQVWSVMGPQPTNMSQPTGGASLLQIQQQEEARLKKQQMIREQQIRAQLAAAQQAQAQAAAARWITAKGTVASPTAGKSFLEIQMEQQKTVIANPPPAPKQSGTAWNNPGTSNHVPTKNTSSTGPTGGVWQTQPAIHQRLPRTNELDDDFWDLCMKDIPAAHRPTSLPQSRGGQTKTATAKQKRMDKQEERIRNIFATPTANDDLVDWCESQFATIQTELDAPTFVNFLLQFESPHEVHDYVKLHIGDTPASKEFTRQFLERAKQCKQQKATNTTSVSSTSMPQVTRSKLTQEEAYPLPGSTIPSKSSSKQENGTAKPSAGTPTTPVGANGGSKKKKKGKMQKIDPASILGFSVNAAERPNAGEIQSVHDAH